MLITEWASLKQKNLSKSFEISAFQITNDLEEKQEKEKQEKILVKVKAKHDFTAKFPTELSFNSVSWSFENFSFDWFYIEIAISFFKLSLDLPIHCHP